ncbi:MAG TPA: D-sedoheptulose 7-phosphate isomerase [Desulfovibrio sp.]|jgi:D-sedoheptulose 7-phosphate isomerase|uniref:D-sedoheptulose 7-phosphate isomerase n=1 Tax=Desulfovibrio TaxID=872 RepID=UPI0003FB139C|nr:MULTISPECIES: D-sedoheptulose 7-phosphate isomerase [Desulfovibrio]HMM38235.1 D-sedoheptulose 7-phosphate isomerase [Desulfovibrio sp.]
MSEKALAKIREHARKGLEIREKFFEERSGQLVEIARAMAVCLARGGKILFCGNGGSAADSQHLAAEFVNRFVLERPPLPALALTTDTSILTAIGNDYGFDRVFEKQVQALGNRGDVLVGISTSGASPNVLTALREARRRELVTVGMTGQQGGEMQPLCDHLIQVPGRETALVQEIHIAAGHMLCHIVDHFLFESVLELDPYLSGGA